MRKLYTFIAAGFLLIILAPFISTGMPGGNSIPAGVYSLPYFQDFDGSTLLPPDWSGGMEVMSQHGIDNSNGLAFNLYDDPLAQTCQAVSPQVQLSANPCRIGFYYRIVDWDNYPNSATVLGLNDKVEVQISTDNGVSFSTIYTINNLNHNAATSFANTIISLSSYTGIVSFRFLCTWGSGDYFVDIDDFIAEEVPACASPYGLSVSGISSTGFNINWSGASTVDIDYGAEGHPAGSGAIISGITSNPYALTGLAPLTSYDVYLRQDCGSGIHSEWTGPLTVSTSDEFSLSIYAVTDLNGTGYVSNMTMTKNGPAIHASAAVNDTTGRGFMKFSLSAVPAGAVITKAMLSYYNYWKEGSSSALNTVHPLESDPVTTTGPSLYADCGDGPELWSGVWSGTAPVWINSNLNTQGISYLAGQAGAGWAGFGLVRGSTALFKISGNDQGSFSPTLQLEYHIPTTPVISIQPASYDFQQVHLGYQSDPKHFTIKNVGAGILTVDAVQLDGADAIHFVLTDLTTYPKLLTSGESYTVSVYFEPESTGVKLANLKITDQAGQHLVPLTGTGYLNPPRNLTATAVEGSDIFLSWQPPVAPGLQKVAGMSYTLHRGTAPGQYNHTVTGIYDTSYLDNTTSQSTLYYYMVSAEYPSGSAPSGEVSVTTFPGCPPPTSLTVSDITNNAASLGWNANGTTGWEIEWGAAGFIKGTGTVIIAGVTNPYVLTGLSAGTAYDFYIRSDCGSGEYSDWSGPATFTTTCPVFTAPFTEDFELPAFPPLCWSKTAGPPTWSRSFTVSSYGTGSGSALANFLNISQADPFDLMTIAFNASGLYQPLMKFDYAYATYSTEIDSLKIYYSTNGGATYILLAGLAGGPTGILNTGGSVTTAFVPTVNQWSTYSITLPPGADKIRFTALSAWGNNLYIDNVKIEAGIPPVPQNLSVSGLVSSGQTKCYNATQVITVAGSATTYTLQSGASANFIAGQKVSFLAGTSIKSGSIMHAYIAASGPWCPLTPEAGDNLATTQDGIAGAPPVSPVYFILYPNPTSGKVMLVQKGDRVPEHIEAEIFSMQGNRVLVSGMQGSRQIELNTSDLQPGLYFVKVRGEGYSETIKLVKVR